MTAFAHGPAALRGCEVLSKSRSDGSAERLCVCAAMTAWNQSCAKLTRKPRLRRRCRVNEALSACSSRTRDWTKRSFVLRASENQSASATSTADVWPRQQALVSTTQDNMEPRRLPPSRWRIASLATGFYILLAGSAMLLYPVQVMRLAAPRVSVVGQQTTGKVFEAGLRYPIHTLWLRLLGAVAQLFGFYYIAEALLPERGFLSSSVSARIYLASAFFAIGAAHSSPPLLLPFLAVANFIGAIAMWLALRRNSRFASAFERVTSLSRQQVVRNSYRNAPVQRFRPELENESTSDLSGLSWAPSFVSSSQCLLLTRRYSSPLMSLSSPDGTIVRRISGRAPSSDEEVRAAGWTAAVLDSAKLPGEAQRSEPLAWFSIKSRLKLSLRLVASPLAAHRREEQEVVIDAGDGIEAEVSPRDARLCLVRRPGARVELREFALEGETGHGLGGHGGVKTVAELEVPDRGKCVCAGPVWSKDGRLCAVAFAMEGTSRSLLCLYDIASARSRKIESIGSSVVIGSRCTRRYDSLISIIRFSPCGTRVLAVQLNGTLSITGAKDHWFARRMECMRDDARNGMRVLDASVSVSKSVVGNAEVVLLATSTGVHLVDALADLRLGEILESSNAPPGLRKCTVSSTGDFVLASVPPSTRSGNASLATVQRNCNAVSLLSCAQAWWYALAEYDQNL